MSILTYIAGWPLLAALVLILVPRNYRVIIRAIAVLATLISAVLAIKMFAQFVPGAAGFQFEQQIPWVESLGISYHVGVDGLNVGLILMGAIVAFAAALCSFEIQKREKEFYILLLVMTGGILGAFASLDLFFFYFFHELAPDAPFERLFVDLEASPYGDLVEAKNGTVKVPDGPGLGRDPDMAVLRRDLVREPGVFRG